MKGKTCFGLLIVLFLFVSIYFYGAIPAQERAALIALYNSTNGDSWANNSGWKTPPLDLDGFALPGTEGSWYGIVVLEDHVIKIAFYSNQLSGSIPPELENLSNMEGLILFNNQLSGSIPTELINLSNLQELRLNYNQLSGGIPSQLGNLGNLQRLYLDNNLLSSSIPSQLGNLINLHYLNLSGNFLIGDIPSNFVNLTNMSMLDISYNCLFAADATLRTWLDAHDPDWESTQTNCFTITINSPNGGENWVFGSSHNIIWTSEPVGNVKIDYSFDNGSNWTEITANTENDGSYTWTVPSISSTNCLVRVSEIDGNPTDISDAVFTISEGITGRVIDSSGNGIANVSVQAYTFVSTSYVEGASTDAEGNYSIGGLTPGNYKVYFQSPGNLNYINQWYNNKNSSEIADPVIITAGQMASGINAQLAEGGIISGRVTDVSGNGIEDISVQVNYLNIVNTFTDSDGNYSVGGMSSGQYKIFFRSFQKNYVPEWYNDKASFDTAEQVTVTIGQTTSGIDAQLALGGIILGRVTNESGNGIANVSVQVYSFDSMSYVGSVGTDADGNYSIGGLTSGNYKVYFYPPTDSNYVQQWFSIKDSSETADPLNVIVGQTTSGINAQLVLGGTISGRVTDESGVGISDINVGIHLNSSSLWSSTDANGYYTVRCIPAGNCTVIFSPSYSAKYIEEWYNDKNSQETADILNVTSGQAINNIDAQLAEGGIISGLVTDESSNGIEGISIYIYDLNNSYITNACTDSQGNYLLGGIFGGEYKIFFRDNEQNYVTEWYNDKTSFEAADPITITVGQTTSNIDAQLIKGGIICGTVTDTVGTPLENINVIAINSAKATSKIAHTDSLGQYVIQELPTGTYNICFSNNGQNYFDEWYNNKTTFETADSLNVVAGQTIANINAQLEQGGRISGTVTDSSGNAIFFVSVYIFDINNQYITGTFTKSGGYYITEVLQAGNYKILFAPPSGSTYIHEFYNDKNYFETADPVMVTVGQTISNINAQLNEGVVISGTVTSTTGTPLEDIRVEARTSANEIQKSVYTDSSGQYVIQELPAGTYKIYFYNNGQNYFSIWYNNKTTYETADPLNPTAGQTIPNIDAQLVQGGSVSGTITDSLGNPIPLISIIIYDLNYQYFGSISTNSSGYYTIARLPTGNYKIFFIPPDDNEYLSEWYNDKTSFTVADTIPVTIGHATTDVDAQLAESGTISGRVTDEYGVGIANITVYVEKDWTDVDYWVGQTDANGNYQVTGIMAGTYHVYFLSPITPVSYAPQIYNGKVIKNSPEMEGNWVQVTNGGITPNIDAILSPAGTVTGQVTDGSGNGIQNIRVHLYNAGGDSFAYLNASTDYYGYYTIYRVPPGQLKAYFSSSEGAGGQYKGVFYNNKQTLGGADTFVVQAGVVTADINAVMIAGGATISGYVRLKSGQAINGAAIKLYDMIGPYSLLSQVSTTSNGYFEFKGLLPGTYKLNASCKSIYAAEWYNEKATHAAANLITITEGGAAQIEITLGETAALQVTSPNGGEVWNAGSLHAITWTNAGPVGDVKIEYSIDNGLNWIEIVSAMENTGNYNWIVPTAPSTNCKVRISGPGGVPTDLSDAVFTIYSNPAGWVPVIGMQNNMVAYGKAYHGITAAAAGDWLGAFGPGGVSDCRAVAAIGANGSYYLTVGSNASSAETITFNLFPLPSGPSMDSSESIEFISDNVYADLPLHFGTGTQSFQMVNGWNWISFHVLPDNTTLSSVFAPILGYIEQVKSQTQAAVYSGGNWIGDLTDMSGVDNGIMYKVKTIQPSSLIVNGGIISFNKPLPLITGWNWTAYLPTAALPVGTAIDSIFSQLNQIKSQTQSAIKIGDGLIGDLTQVAPNNGYTIKMTAPGELVYPYCVLSSPDQALGTIVEANSSAQTVSWKTIKGNQYNMVAYGKVFLEGKAINGPGYYLVTEGPKGEGDCRSINPVGNDGNYFSTILGNTNGDTIKFKLYNSNSHKTYGLVGSIRFQADDLKSDYNLRARSVRITAPSEGEKLNMGSVCNITWDAYEVSNVKIELYKNGKSLSIISKSMPANSHTFSWTIPARMHSGNNYQIKISSVDAGGMAEDMTGNFNILPTAVLTLNYPVGMETWQVKRSYDITWGSSGIDNIKIELYKGAVLNTVISESTPAAAGKYTWSVPANQALGSDYKIKISSVDVGVNVSDIGKSTFSITAYKNTCGDFDGDGRADLVWRYYETGGFNCIWLSGVGQGSAAVNDARLAPQAVTIQDETNLDNEIKGTGDFNHDGKEDLLWRDKETGANSVWFMNGTTFAGTALLPSETTLSWDICGIGDFNSDGKIDILWRNTINGSNKVWLMNGITRTGEVSLTTEAELNWNIVGAGDFNNDGKPDILWRKISDGTNRIWIMNGTMFGRAEQLSAVNVDWEVVGVGDYDSNGKTDIFWRHRVDGRDIVWIMDGLARVESLNLTRVTDVNWKIEN